MVIVYSNSAP